MVTIIHGSDTTSSRRYFTEQKENVKNPIMLDGEKINTSELLQASDTGMLFEDEKKIFIEEFFSKRKVGKEYNEIIKIIKESKDSDIFFWEKKELSKKQLSLLPKANIKTFNHPQSVFIFLDSIKPGNKNSILLFHNALNTGETELIFHLLVRHFRIMLAIISNSAIDEINYMAPWQRSKLTKQASFFSEEILKNLYKKLFEIDLGIKTGKSSLNLAQSIDFFLLDL